MYAQSKKQEKNNSRININSATQKKISTQKRIEPEDNQKPKPARDINTRTSTAKEKKAIQLMTRRGLYDFTSNLHFAIKTIGQARTLYSDKTNQITPSDFFVENGTVAINTATGRPATGGTVFTKIEPKAELYDQDTQKKYPDYCGPQDCVRYAAALVNNAKDWGERYPMLTNFVMNPGPNIPFDYTGANTALADNATNAVGGEMMYTTRQGYIGGPGPAGVYNFHGTSVIAVDGSEQVTSEACVGSGRKKPNFMLYSNAVPVVAGQIQMPTFSAKYAPVIAVPGLGAAGAQVDARVQ